MKKVLWIILSVFFFTYSAIGSGIRADAQNKELVVSGKVVNGYRILSIERGAGSIDLKVYRGDYIKFKFPPDVKDPLLSIPELAIHKRLPDNPAQAPYFKMKTPGTFAFSLGGVDGRITVLNYRQASYREVSSREAADLIEREAPIILDVRTPSEYKRGHLQNSVLIPVQELQRRYQELGADKDREILIYCATGNRSTVASKILIDSGFKHVVNMRGGIYDWGKRKYPIAR